MKARRKLGPPRGYRPAGEPIGYEPERNSRKAPSGYWCRYPYKQDTLKKVQESRVKKNPSTTVASIKKYVDDALRRGGYGGLRGKVAEALVYRDKSHYDTAGGSHGAMSDFTSLDKVGSMLRPGRVLDVFVYRPDPYDPGEVGDLITNVVITL